MLRQSGRLPYKLVNTGTITIHALGRWFNVFSCRPRGPDGFSLCFGSCAITSSLASLEPGAHSTVPLLAVKCRFFACVDRPPLIYEFCGEVSHRNQSALSQGGVKIWKRLIKSRTATST